MYRGIIIISKPLIFVDFDVVLNHQLVAVYIIVK